MCVRLFGDYLGVILKVFWQDFEGTTIQKTTKNAKTLFFTVYARAMGSKMSVLALRGAIKGPKCFIKHG